MKGNRSLLDFLLEDLVLLVKLALDLADGNTTVPEVRQTTTVSGPNSSSNPEIGVRTIPVARNRTAELIAQTTPKSVCTGKKSTQFQGNGRPEQICDPNYHRGDQQIPDDENAHDDHPEGRALMDGGQ